jgi:hypothetical protein
LAQLYVVARRGRGPVAVFASVEDAYGALCRMLADDRASNDELFLAPFDDDFVAHQQPEQPGPRNPPGK